MNQVSRQKAQTDVEKDFYKLMDNANFGYDCHNNANNCQFSPTYDETDELLYAEGYQNIFDQSISNFVLSEILERQIEEEFLNKIGKLDQNNDIMKQGKIPSRYRKKRA